MMKLTAVSAGTLTSGRPLGLGIFCANQSPSKTPPRHSRRAETRDGGCAQDRDTAAPPRPLLRRRPDLTKQCCIGCHSEKGKAGGLVARRASIRRSVDQHADVARKDDPQAARWG